MGFVVMTTPCQTDHQLSATLKVKIHAAVTRGLDNVVILQAIALAHTA